MAQIIGLKLKQFGRALASLREAVKKRETEIIRDATIQRFEFSFELLWKTLKIYLLEKEGCDIATPKQVFRAARNAGLISDNETVLSLKMTDDRNQTVHIYKESQARQIYHRIKKDYFPLMEAILERLQGRKTS
jgi:nucleotidyltransferase substrate binding protein (TIGR01987 family)